MSSITLSFSDLFAPFFLSFSSLLFLRPVRVISMLPTFFLFWDAPGLTPPSRTLPRIPLFSRSYDPRLIGVSRGPDPVDPAFTRPSFFIPPAVTQNAPPDFGKRVLKKVGRI